MRRRGYNCLHPAARCAIYALSALLLVAVSTQGALSFA